jgi:preprotein translocase subunit SecF
MRTPNVDFVGRRRRWAVISGILLLVSIAELGIRGLNLSIDFVGGSSFLMEEVANTELTTQQLREAAEDAGASDVVAQITTEDGVPIGATVRTEAIELGSDQEHAVTEALAEVTGAEEVGVTFVGPSWGERISAKALQALAVFIAVVILYISWRLEFKMAIAAILALVHDVVITIGVYALVGFNVSPSTVIALLTILGYSLYDSVVVFDRVEENTAMLGGPGKRTYAEAVNTSMNEVLWRSINTSLTSLLPVGALLLIGAQVLGASTLQDLALALFVGMALGTYSSLFVAGPFLAWWKEQEPEHIHRRQRLEERVAAGQEPESIHAHDATASRAPITTEYVRGRGKRKRRG